MRSMAEGSGGEPRWRVLVVGCGAMSRRWLQYLTARADLEVVGLVDVAPQAAAARAAEVGLEVPHFTTVERAIAETAPAVVCDVTVPEAHASVAAAALQAGCHVLSEKPLAASMQEARATTALARSSGLTCAVMQNRRYSAPIRAAQAIVAAQQLGNLGILNADFYCGPHFGGFREQMRSPLVLDMAIHTFDQARFISGRDPVAVLHCHEFNPHWSWYAHGAAASVVFEMTGGLVFSYRGCWCTAEQPTAGDAAWRLHGDRGALLWDGAGHPAVELTGDATPSAPSAPAPYRGRAGHAGCLDEMFAAIAQGRPAETACTDHLKSLAMVFAALESFRRREPVPIAELLPQ